ncbi:MAG: heme ABC exporter ATP-binding protein CcmA [Gaiellales bacterium]
MPSPDVVACDGLVRRFGERAALDGVDLHLAGGEFVLVTGPNGAGKTTLLRVLATVIRPSAGAVAVAGHELPRAAQKARPLIGYVAHASLAYPGLTARENLELYAALYGVPAERIDPALERVGLDGRGRDPVAEFSRGMSQRLALARAVLHGPSLLLLDEPTAGLDSDGREVLREVLAEPGRTVIVSTHEPAWFEGLATAEVRLAAGRVAA